MDAVVPKPILTTSPAPYPSPRILTVLPTIPDAGTGEYIFASI